jgi:hypothetical protein
MKTVNWWLETGFSGCNHDGSFEVADDATDEEIERRRKRVLEQKDAIKIATQKERDKE